MTDCITNKPINEFTSVSRRSPSLSESTITTTRSFRLHRIACRPAKTRERERGHGFLTVVDMLTKKHTYICVRDICSQSAHGILSVNTMETRLVGIGCRPRKTNAASFWSGRMTSGCSSRISWQTVRDVWFRSFCSLSCNTRKYRPTKFLMSLNVHPLNVMTMLVSLQSM